MRKSNRRNFIRNIGLSGVAASVLPTTVLATSQQAADEPQPGNDIASKHNYNGTYTGAYLNRVAFPIGGLGAGMFCLEGTGAISHLSIRHKPDVFNEPGLFAALHIKDHPNATKILEGPVPDWKKFGQAGTGNGAAGATTGLPRFQQATFQARFPFASIDLADNAIPLQVRLTGWSPFIPTDENNSSLPVGAIEYRFTNKSSKTIDAIFSYNAKNFLQVENGTNRVRAYNNGFILSEDGPKEKAFLKSDFAIFAPDENATVDHCWFRGGWWDPLTMAWNKIKAGVAEAVVPVSADAPGASLFIPFTLAAGTTKTIKLLFAWYVPDSDMTFGKGEAKGSDCDPASGCCSSPSQLRLDKYDADFGAPFYKPWYSNSFKDIDMLCGYWKRAYNKLHKASMLFKEAFYSSTLPPEVLEAVAANLTILKSPTVLRQFDGRLWNFEGCGDTWGCCHGSCTHVWNYAQAVPHLFPALERSLRHTEFCESQNAQGHQTFRAALPIKPVDHAFYAAADGQLGGIMKVYREWRISGDNEWAKKMYPMVKSSLDFCIRTWDPHHRGRIEEPHHNTYDIEFWGPDGMHASFYLGALQAFIKMSDALQQDATLYQELFTKGKAFTETELYNGEYFIQKIQYTGLDAKNPAETSGETFGGTYSDEAKKLLEQEGPKYQYGTGCLADGILGAWIARMCGLPDVVDAQKVRSHLLAVHKYNLKANLSDHANPQRPAYALGDEGGLLLCTWPKGGKLSLPFVYSDEVWTGIEHQVAAHLMLTGRVKEGLEILRTSRNRYDGRVRNPFNEYECGHWYARALASYGYLQGLTGVRFDAVEKTLYVDSKIGDFVSFLSTETGFGTVTYKSGHASVQVAYGSIPVEKTVIGSNAALQKS